ncbi:MAG: hypothetical protein ABIM73_06515 [Arenimonas sp.]
MTCKLRQRKDDIPKHSPREKTWVCDTCQAIIFGPVKPACRREMEARVSVMHDAAEADFRDNGYPRLK